MVSRFTRKFDPEKPRDPAAELYDTHRPPPPTRIPYPRPGTVLVLPGGRPHSLYHRKRDCEALIADVRLTAQCGQDLRPAPANLQAVRDRDDLVGCPLCLGTETDYAKFKACSVDVGSRRHEGMLLLWRKDPGIGWCGVVVYEPRYRFVAEIRSARELRELPPAG
jgi:hypothetical protein